MEFMPALKFSWLGGWIPIILSSSIQWGLLLSMPKDVYARLFDRQGWSKKRKTFFRLGKLVALVCLALMVFSPLKTGSSLFILGIGLYALGLIGLIVSLFNFRDTPLDQPVSRGLYKISRHPQILSTTTIFLGICFMLGSWLLLLLLALAKLLEHFGILAEEESCLQQYGDAYRDYLQRVPRYFLFF